MIVDKISCLFRSRKSSTLSNEESKHKNDVTMMSPSPTSSHSSTDQMKMNGSQPTGMLVHCVSFLMDVSGIS